MTHTGRRNKAKKRFFLKNWRQQNINILLLHLWGRKSVSVWDWFMHPYVCVCTHIETHIRISHKYKASSVMNRWFHNNWHRLNSCNLTTIRPNKQVSIFHDSTAPLSLRSLCALLDKLHLLFAKNGFWAASLSLEQLFHQLLPSSASPGGPQCSPLPQAQWAEQPRVVQKGSLDEFMCKRWYRRT